MCKRARHADFSYADKNWNGIDLADPHWWNFYDKVGDLGIRGIIVEYRQFRWSMGRSRGRALGTRPDGTAGRRIVSQPFEYCTNMINLMFGGLMDSFPEFNFAFLEAGVSLPSTLRRRIKENVEQIAYLQDNLTSPIDKYFDRFYFVVDDLLLEDEGKRLTAAVDRPRSRSPVLRIGLSPRRRPLGRGFQDKPARQYFDRGEGENTWRECGCIYGGKVRILTAKVKRESGGNAMVVVEGPIKQLKVNP